MDNKTRVVIYYNVNQPQSILITNYIKKNIAVLKNSCVFNFVNVDASNQHHILNKGINAVPSITIGNRVISKCKAIINCFEAMKQTYSKALKNPPEYNLDAIARREVEEARKNKGTRDGQFVWNEPREEKEDDDKMFLQKVAKFRQGQTDFNRGYEEKHRPLKNKGNVQFGEEGGEGDEKFMKASGFYDELASDEMQSEEDFRKYANRSLMEPIYSNN